MSMKVYTVDDFILKTKEEPLKYITYCEVLISESGRIITWNTSCHATIAAKFVTKAYNINKESLTSEIPDDCLPLEWIVDKYKLIAVWYSGYMHHSMGPNEKQQESLDKLYNEGLITYQYIQPATEYTKYLERQKVFENQ